MNAALLRVCLAVLFYATVFRPAWAEDRPPRRLIIQVEDAGWNASTDDVQAVLNSAADQVFIYFPDRKLEPILVSHREGVPITLDQKGPAGEFQVHLSAGNSFWAQYTYQFAHELCHVLAHYDHHHRGQNQWFEESLCETSSLFVLSKMHKSWETHPPYTNWKTWGVHFDEYLNEILANRSRRLPPEVTMPQWLAANLPELEKDTQLNDRSKMVAAYLLTLFQDEPTGWESLDWLNMGQNDDELKFDQYLQAWHNRVPPRHKLFVAKIQGLFGYHPAK